MEYAELQCTSNFSLLTGASHPDEIILSAHALGYSAVALTDHNTLSGVVRAHVSAKEQELTFHVGCRLIVAYEEGLPSDKSSYPSFDVLAYPINREAYGNLCRLLTIGKLRAGKEGCFLTLSDLIAYKKDLVFTIVPPFFSNNYENIEKLNFFEACKQLKDECTGSNTLSMSVTRNYSRHNHQFISNVLETARHLGIPPIASGDIYYHTPERRALCDVLSCIRHRCTIEQAGFRVFQNAERYLKPIDEIRRLFRDLPDALRRTVEISRMLSFSLDELRYQYPHEIPAGMNALEYLSDLTWKGANERYPEGIPKKVKATIESELVLIHELNYEKYFLTCHDIVRFARSREILCQGRGAAANSAVCYALGITAVDPDKIDLLFARFISKERNEPPDIDIDFEHERREEVIQYIYEKYGREHAGLTCEVVTYQPRSAIRDVGKALGLGLQIVDKLAKSVHRWTACELSRETLKEEGLNPDDSAIFNTVLLTQLLLDFPRHLSQHVGGFIISETPLCETVPILNAAMPDRTIIEWNKDDIDALGILKIDCLGLGMLTCIRKALAMVNAEKAADEVPLELYSLPSDDKNVYDMICAADTLGVFQIESRAQMSMLPRLKPRCFYDLVIEVAIVRPGPIQGNMVHPFLKRRSGLEPVSFPDERVREVLGKTLGVPIFQEQAMRLAIVLADFTPGEAEKLRRAIAAWRRNKEVIAQFKERVVRGMVAKGYSKEYAETCMHQIKGFSEYGFPESHAASFALLAYASSWLKFHYPAHFAAALLNSQPMGFYAPAQIIQDAKAHGILPLPIDINHSDWDCAVEQYAGKNALRLGMRMANGLQEEQARIIVAAIQKHGRASSVQELWLKCRAEGRVRLAALKVLARADAFSSMNLSRREAFWEIRSLPSEPLPLDTFDTLAQGAKVPLPSTTVQQEMFDDYAALGLSLRAHPIQFIRADLNRRMVSTAAHLKALVQKRRNPSVKTYVSAAGIAILRQRPQTAKGVVFITLEDETGVVNLIIRPRVFEVHAKFVLSHSCLLAHGTLDSVGDIVYINTEQVESLDSQILVNKKSDLPNRSFSY